MTREPANPRSSDEASRPSGPGGATPSGWAGDDAGAGLWGGDIGATAKAPTPSASAFAPDAKGAGWSDGSDLDLIVHNEPWRLSHLMIAIVGVAFFLWLWINLRMLAIVLIPIGLLVMAITAGFVLARLRASRQEALLSLLAIAAERDMPLAPAVSAFADQFKGRAQRAMLGIVAELEAGKPLHEALGGPPVTAYQRAGRMALRFFVWGWVGDQLFYENTGKRRRRLSRDALLMARIGQETGLLAPALRLVGGARAAQVGAWSSISSRLAYLLVVMLIGENIAGFQLYFIVPRFEAIFADFGIPLPALTINLIRSAQFLVGYAPIFLLLYLAQIVLLVFLPFSFVGWMNYQVPLIDRLFARRHTALVLRALSIPIEANRPIGLALEILAQQYPAHWVRRRLARVSKQVDRGADWIDALWRAHVIRRPDAEVLASAASVGNLAWACRELADTAERRQSLRLQLLVQAIFPLAIIAIGVAVATLCLGYFLPLVNLIQRLSDL